MSGLIENPAGELRIRCLSDLHGRKEYLDPHGADILVVAGDIAPLRRLDTWAKRAQCEWMAEDFRSIVAAHPGCEFVFTPGNHDFWGLEPAMNPNSSFWPKNAHLLLDSGCCVRGMTFWGSPIVPFIGSSRRWAFECGDSVQRRVFSGMPDGLDFLVTHTPPALPGSDIDCEGVLIGSGRPLHFGSAPLAEAIAEKKPRRAVCGHIHSGSHEPVMFCKTLCLNVSVLDAAYRPAWKPREFFQDSLLYDNHQICYNIRRGDGQDESFGRVP